MIGPIPVGFFRIGLSIITGQLADVAFDLATPQTMGVTAVALCLVWAGGLLAIHSRTERS